MGQEVPLLNEYKQDFFWKRLPQTLLGGPKLKLGFPAPAYVYINQVTLFLLPWLLGGLFTILVEFNVLEAYIAYYVYGGSMVIYVLAAQLISLIVQRRADTVAAFQNTNVLAEEDEVEFDSCCGYETFQYIVPLKRWKTNILLHALVSGLMGGLGFWYLLPSVLNPLFNNVGATVVLFIFGWLTICIAQYPLSTGSPPEPASFRAIDTLELLPLLRPCYVLICLFVHLAWSFDTSALLLSNQILHVVFIFLPVLWCLGILPPIDALVLWLMEQTLVHFLGGSPMAGDLRCCLMFVISVIISVIANFIPTPLAIIVFSACLGYILSLDLSILANQVMAFIKRCIQKPTNHSPSHKRKCSPEQDALEADTELNDAGLGWRFGWRELLINTCMVTVVGAVSGVCVHFSSSVAPSVVRGLGYAVISLMMLVKIMGSCQQVFIFWGMFRNKLYPDSITSTQKYSSRKRKLYRLGLIKRFLVDLICPFIMEAYLGLILVYTGLSLPSVWFAVGAVYSLRRIWQHTRSSLLDVSILHVLLELRLYGGLTYVSWWPTDFGLQLILIGFLHSWICQSLHKVYCYLTILITSYTIEKQRRKSSLPLIVISIILFPIVLATIMASSIMSAPVLPLFTLPILLIGFPRPLRSWPGAVGAAANVCADTVYYKQLERSLKGVLRRAVATGSLGEISPGSFLLLRFQDRMAWLQVLECGYGFMTISLKGMELQETSCHTVEAARLDDIFEVAFTHPKEKFPVCSLNQFPMHTLTPVDAQPVDTYSDARNVLTGIIDSPYTLEMVDSCFIKTLVWLLLRHNCAKRKDLPTPSSTNSDFNAGNINGRGSVSSRTRLVQTNRIVSVSEDSGRAESIQSKPMSSQANKHGQTKRKSLVGSWHSLDSWDDDPLELEVMNAKPKLNSSANKKEAQVLKEPAGLPGAISDISDDEVDGVDDLLNEFEFGLPAVDIHAPKKTTPATKNSPFAQRKINLNTSAQFSSPHSSKLSLPLKWREIPLDQSLLAPLLQKFPLEWYKHVIGQLGIESNKSPGDTTTEISSDEALTTMYANLVMACYGIVNVFGLGGVSAVAAGASHVYKVYSGDIPWSMNQEWLTSDEELHEIVLQAYRFAFKLAYDQTVLGEASDLDEIVEYLQEYESEWYMGRDTDAEWVEAVRNNKPRLFSLIYDANENTYNGRVLSRQPVVVHIGKLNSEMVRSLWSSLSLELFYFTNDDEERYSIQAHPVILRNLTVQAADPPLGYPIYASEPLSIPTW
ncbi:pecanex-like protein 4 [Lytechinus pictus]|uniref:pecanex-like protein 4 n=1 Tax=Lytechinus pictus TaxID=7653 RepID=UPI0030B9E0B3